MNRWTRCLLSLALGCAVLMPSLPARADEGMWLYNSPPLKQLKERYDFTPTREWLEHLQMSSVRFNSGGSGSFVSSHGLVMTNHHVGADQIAKLSGPGKDLMASGYLAATPDRELRCPDLELNVLESIQDVTEQVEGPVKPGMDAEAAEKARRAAMNSLEKSEADRTGLRCDVVTLYQGGQYHLYRYKKYTDVRLVFCPEQDIAFFGGDPDNFEYPRFDLDVTFFRVYENGKPAQIKHFLAWSPNGAQEGELVFVSGHPGRTDRQNVMRDLEFLRDRRLPFVLNFLRRLEVLYLTYGDRSEENARQAKDELFGVQNSRKALLGQLQGLQDPAFMKVRRDAEQAFLQAIEADPRLKAICGDAWAQVEAAIKTHSEILTDYYLLERHWAFESRLYEIAFHLVRLAQEKGLPNADRLREYRESNLESLEQDLFSPAPIYKSLEKAKLASSLGLMMEVRGAEDPLVQRVLAGKSPVERAAEIVDGTRLDEVAERKRLAAGGPEAVKSSTDPMILLALLANEDSRRVRKIYDEKVSEPLRQAYSKLARARFALYGQDIPPDATFTLRLAFGVVKGYSEGGRKLPAFTTFAGLYQRSAEHHDQPPFQLPKRWVQRKSALNLKTPFNFVHTADIIGGNSGSPTVNRKGEVVGLIFDGNIQSLVLDYAYSEQQARALSVDSRAILEALRKVYDAPALADELGH